MRTGQLIQVPAWENSLSGRAVGEGPKGIGSSPFSPTKNF